MLRLRQIAFAAADLAAAEQALVAALGVQLCFRDPGVGVFGLHNALFPVGDQFLEIVSPIEPNTTAGRLLAKRGGDGGYMVLFQTDDLAGVEQRVGDAGIRIVFDARGDGIRGLHLHPKDVPGVIVSVDQADQPAEWPWAGPTWRDHVATDTAHSIIGVEIAVHEPAAVSATWARVLGTEAVGESLHLDDAIVRFSALASPDAHEGIVAIDLATADATLAGSTRELLGVTLRFLDA